MLQSWIGTINTVHQLLVTNSLAIGIDPDYVQISNGYGLDTPAPFIMIGAEWNRKITHNSSTAEIRLTIRIGAESDSNRAAAEVAMDKINKVCTVMDNNGYTLDNIEPLFFSSDRTIFDADYLVTIKVFGFLTDEELNGLDSIIMS